MLSTLLVLTVFLLEVGLGLADAQLCKKRLGQRTAILAIVQDRSSRMLLRAHSNVLSALEAHAWRNFIKFIAMKGETRQSSIQEIT